MVADLALDIKDSAYENTPEHIFTEIKNLSNLVNMAAQGLVNYATLQRPVEMSSWGSSERVFEEIADKLTPYHGRALAEEMAYELVKDAEDHATKFRSRHNTKAIGVILTVADQVPEGQFETGAKQVHRYDIKSKNVEIIGSSSVEVRLTASGTAMTTNRADVDAMFAGPNNIKTLWAVFEAPNREELEGIANDTALTALSNIAEGSMSPEEIQELLAELQKLVDEGLLSPEMLKVVENIQAITMLAEFGMTPEIQSQIQDIASETIETLNEAIKEGMISAELAESIIETIQEIGEKHGIENIIPEVDLSSAEMIIETQQIKDKIEYLIAEDGFDAEALAALVEGIHELEGQDLLNRLDEIKVEVSALDLPPELQVIVAEITQDISSLQETVKATLPPTEAEVALQMTSEEILTMLQSLDGIDFDALTPEQQEALTELKESLDILDVENLTAEDIKEILNSETGSELKAALETIVIEVNKEVVQLALPQENINVVNQFLKTEESFVTEVAQLAAIQTLTEALETMDPTSEEYAQVQEVLEKLEAGESIKDIDHAIIEQVIEQLGDQVPQTLMDAVEIVVATQSEPVVLSTETLEIVQNIAGDFDTIVEELQSLKESGDITSEEEALLEKIEIIVEKLTTDPTSIAVLVELSQIDQATFEQIAEMLPHSVLETIENLQTNVENVIDIQKDAYAIHHEITPENIETIVDLANDLNANKDALIEAGITDLDQIIDKITSDPTSTEAAVEIQEILQNPDIPDAIKEQLTAQLESVQEIQISTIAAEFNIEPAQAIAIVETVAAMENMSSEIKETLAEVGIDVATITDTIKNNPTSLEAAGEIAKLEQMIVDPNTPPEVREALQEQLGEIIADVKEAQVSSIAAELNIEPAQAAAIVETMVAMDSLSEGQQQVLLDAGVNITELSQAIQSTNAQDLGKIVEALNQPEAMEALREQGIDTQVLEAKLEVAAKELGVSVETLKLNIITMQEVEFIAQEMSSAPEGLDTLIETIKRDPQIMADPAVQEILQDLKTGDIAVTLDIVQDLDKAVTMAAIANETMTTQPDFPAEAVVQQIDAIAQNADAGAVDTLESIKQTIEQFADDKVENPTIGETNTTVAEIDALIKDGDLPSQEVSQLQAVKDKLTQVVESETTTNIEIEVNNQANYHNLEINTEPLVSSNTLNNLEAITLTKFASASEKEAIVSYLKQPHDIKALNTVKEALKENTPPEVIEKLNSTASVSEQGVNNKQNDQLNPMAIFAEQTTNSVSNIRSDDNKNVSQHSIQEGNTENKTTKDQQEEISFESACVGCGGADCASCGTAFNEVTAEQLAEATNDIKNLGDFSLSENEAAAFKAEETSFQTGCEACGGGNCASCGGAFNSVSSEQILDTANDISGLNNFSLSESIIEQPSITEDQSFQTGCEVCGGGDCASCVGAFASVNEGDLREVVSQTVDLGSFSLSEPKLKAA